MYKVLFLVFFFVFGLSFAQSSKVQKVPVSGKINKYQKKGHNEDKRFYLLNDQDEVTPLKVDKNGSFKMTLEINEA
jgi:hypothetical protein